MTCAICRVGDLVLPCGAGEVRRVNHGPCGPSPCPLAPWQSGALGAPGDVDEWLPWSVGAAVGPAWAGCGRPARRAASSVIGPIVIVRFPFPNVGRGAVAANNEGCANNRDSNCRFMVARADATRSSATSAVTLACPKNCGRSPKVKPRSSDHPTCLHKDRELEGLRNESVFTLSRPQRRAPAPARGRLAAAGLVALRGSACRRSRRCEIRCGGSGPCRLRLLLSAMGFVSPKPTARQRSLGMP